MTKRQLSFQHDGLLGAFENKLVERIDSETEALANGQATDFVNYKVRATRIASYGLALDDLRAVVKTYLQEDEDND
jgi:hypothetical protein